MPELPEVESVVRRFRPLLQGRRIVGFRSLWKPNVSPSEAAVRRAVVGRTIAQVRRRGKFIVLDLADDGANGASAAPDLSPTPDARGRRAPSAPGSSRAASRKRIAGGAVAPRATPQPPGHLMFHLRMSGRFEWARPGAHRPPHTRAVLELAGGDAVWFVDARKFGRIVYTSDLASATQRLGLEPLARGFTPQALAALLRGRARRLKPLLLDQSVVAGLGNIYVDEALFAAGLHPLTRSDRVRPAQARRLHQAIRTTLRKAIRHNGTSFDWAYPTGRMQNYLRVYGRAGEPCPRCGTPIEALRVVQRGTHVCPRCQRLA